MRVQGEGTVRPDDDRLFAFAFGVFETRNPLHSASHHHGDMLSQVSETRSASRLEDTELMSTSLGVVAMDRHRDGPA